MGMLMSKSFSVFPSCVTVLVEEDGETSKSLISCSLFNLVIVNSSLASVIRDSST